MACPPPRFSSAESRAETRSGRVLAIDYGRRRIGLALSDERGLVAQPFATLERTNRASDLRRLREIVRRHEVRRIIVGHPLHLNGTAGEMAAEAERFAARLGRQLGLPVELVDERLSSWEAEQLLAEVPRSSARRRKRKDGRGAVDRLAATIVLREYLERRQKERK